MASDTDDTSDLVPYDKLIGITSDGVPVMSNGDITFYSEDVSDIPAYAPLSTYDKVNSVRSSSSKLFTRMGIKWQCVEFVRRYYASRKGLWMRSVPTAEDIWYMEKLFTSMTDGSEVNVVRVENHSRGPAPAVGDMIIWASGHEAPYGHVAIVMHVSETNQVCIAEQNENFTRWRSRERLWNRELPLRIGRDDAKRDDNEAKHSSRSDGGGSHGNTIELVDEDVILGWISVKAPDYDYTTGDVSDMFRLIVGPGCIARVSVPPQVTLPWCDVSNPAHYFLRRSLIHDTSTVEHAGAATIHSTATSPAPTATEVDVPSAFYVMDYDMWCRIARATRSLHRIALEATAKVLHDVDAASLLQNYFGIPHELEQLIRHSWQVTPAMCGRFDFGYDGRRLCMLEYNCDSSAALLECCDIQERMAQCYGFTHGSSAGSFWGATCRSYFTQVMQSSHMCPSHKLIHFMIDDDDEERYTALAVIQLAESVGFRTRLCVKLDDFSFANEEQTEAEGTQGERIRAVVDTNGETVQLVWKTWSWDTVLRQYTEQKKRWEDQGAAQKANDELVDAQPYPRPTLPDILLNRRIHVLEPLWKLLTGSKAILPFMYAVAPDHQNILPASFFRTREIARKHHISKPVNGRAGQNVTMYNPVTNLSMLPDVPSLVSPLFKEGQSLSANTSFSASIAPTQALSFDQTNESSSGKFYNSVMVYQERLFLKKYNHTVFPIFCGWVIGDSFGGVVVREDTSKITKLGSVVVPARVIRSNISLDSLGTDYSNSQDADADVGQS